MAKPADMTVNIHVHVTVDKDVDPKEIARFIRLHLERDDNKRRTLARLRKLA